MTELQSFNRRQRHHTISAIEALQYHVAPAQYESNLVCLSMTSTVPLGHKHIGASSKKTTRKMSVIQLRLFFLLCVTMYFSVIYFADDITSFAQWMSEADPSHQWDETPPSNSVLLDPTPTSVVFTPISTRVKYHGVLKISDPVLNSDNFSVMEDTVEKNRIKTGEDSHSTASTHLRRVERRVEE